MPSDAASFTYLIATARGLLARVMGRDRLVERPRTIRPAAFARLAAGVRVLASFVRRLLVLMALSLEHGLVDRVDAAKALPRPKGAHKRGSRLRFVVLDAPFAMTVLGAGAEVPVHWTERVGKAATRAGARRKPAPSPDRLYRLLDLLAAIVADPSARARRLAFHLARRRHGVLLPPAGPARIAGCWGMSVRASHEAMAGAILSAGRVRPPPLPPPRRRQPSVTAL